MINLITLITPINPDISYGYCSRDVHSPANPWLYRRSSRVRAKPSDRNQVYSAQAIAEGSENWIQTAQKPAKEMLRPSLG